jgi:hypothetical protein
MAGRLGSRRTLRLTFELLHAFAPVFGVHFFALRWFGVDGHGVGTDLPVPHSYLIVDQVGQGLL